MIAISWDIFLILIDKIVNTFSISLLLFLKWEFVSNVTTILLKSSLRWQAWFFWTILPFFWKSFGHLVVIDHYQIAFGFLTDDFNMIHVSSSFDRSLNISIFGVLRNSLLKILWEVHEKNGNIKDCTPALPWRSPMSRLSMSMILSFV